MCICRGFNYSVEAWEIACGIRNPPTISSTPTSTASSRAFNKNDWKYSTEKRINAPAGKYYIGDLCYVLSNDVYDKVFGGAGYESGLYTGPDNQFFLVDGTAYGDGAYRSSDGKEFGVDAGIIGICPVSLMAKDDGGGHIYEFEEPVKCVFKNGIFTFTSGYTSITINTVGTDDDDY